MSEGWKRLYRQDGHSLSVAEGENEVILRESYENGKTWFLYIPAEHRRAVALALLGGLTEELVAQTANALSLGFSADAFWCGSMRDAVAAIFGVTDPADAT